MIKIAHRAVVNKSFKDKDNSPESVEKAIEFGFEAEVDIWKCSNEFYLGHDYPEYRVSKKWVIEHQNLVWFHCKNIEILNEFVENYKEFKFFWHQNDDYALTSNGFIWTYPSLPYTAKSIVVANTQELYNRIHSDLTLLKPHAICSSYFDL